MLTKQTTVDYGTIATGTSILEWLLWLLLPPIASNKIFWSLVRAVISKWY